MAQPNLYQIPFKFVGIRAQAALAMKLDVYDSGGTDWRGLADYLDFTQDEIEVS